MSMKFLFSVFRGIPLLITSLLAVVLFFLGLSWFSTLLFILGVLLGIGLLYGDSHFFSVWYQLDEPFSQSFLFLVIFVPCLVFMMTTSSSPLGNGLVLGIGLVKLSDYLQVLLAQPGTQMHGKKLDGVTVPKEILRGGADAFTLRELQVITVGLAFLILLLVIRTILYV